MSRKLTLPILTLALAASSLSWGQDKRARIDVEHYAITAEINPRTQSIAAKAQVRFVPLDANINSVAFELNNALNVSRVDDETGKQLNFNRSPQDFTARLNFEESLEKGKARTVTFQYSGRLTGSEDSPVFGIKYASIQNQFAYLMYPGRWFPVSGFLTDRFTSEMQITVDSAFTVIGSGVESKRAAGAKTTYSFDFKRPSFPGSIAVVSGTPRSVNSEGVTTRLWFRSNESEMAGLYGTEIGKVMAFFTAKYGLPLSANLAVVETESGAPNGFSAPGILFLSPRGIGTQFNQKLLANQISRQWWGALLSPASRNHLWIADGLAFYSDFLYAEQTRGPSAIESEVREAFTEALTVDNVPLIQAGRLEDYSPEMFALTGSKGAAVLHMLRSVIGDDKFFAALKEFPKRYEWQPVTTDDLRKTVEAAAGQDVGYFFIQWVESSGAPEFKLEYTIFRTQKGFRIMGKIAQDLDTFRMPVELRIETEGNPEEKKVEVMGTSSEFAVETFGKPKNVIIDPAGKVLRFSNNVRMAVAIRRGEQFAEVSEYGEALKEYQKAIETNRNSSLAHYRVGEIFFLQNNYQSAANEFREALSGDLQPKWTEVWAHLQLGKIFDVSGQRERAVNEYNQAVRTKDNTQGAQEEAAKYLKTPYERQKRSDSD